MVSQQASNKRRGAAYEIELEDWLILKSLNAQRLPRAGRNDIGDVSLTIGKDTYVIEAKAPRRDGKIDLSGWLKEADIESENYSQAKKLLRPARPLVVIKASNKGIGESYVVQRLSDVIKQLQA